MPLDIFQRILLRIKSFLPVRSIRFYARMDKLQQSVDRSFLNLQQSVDHSFLELREIIRQERLHIRFQVKKILDRQNFLLQAELARSYETPQAVSSLQKNIEQMLELPDSEILPVVFITDSAYVIPTRVAIGSLLRNRASHVRYQIFVLGVDLSEADSGAFDCFAQAVSLVPVQNTLQDMGKDHPHVSRAALLKFSIAEDFPQFTRILYFDSDIIIRKDVSGLFAVDLGEHYAAVVKDMAGTLMEHHHIKLNHKDYFNSGVMLLNTELMRKVKMKEKLIDAKKNSSYEAHFMDQDALNFAFDENVIYLSPSYNCMYANFVGMDDASIASFYGLRYHEWLQILHDPAVLHLTNIEKPWDSPDAFKYEEYKKEEYLLKCSE